MAQVAAPPSASRRFLQWFAAGGGGGAGAAAAAAAGAAAVAAAADGAVCVVVPVVEAHHLASIPEDVSVKGAATIRRFPSGKLAAAAPAPELRRSCSAAAGDAEAGDDACARVEAGAGKGSWMQLAPAALAPARWDRRSTARAVLHVTLMLALGAMAVVAAAYAARAAMAATEEWWAAHKAALRGGRLL